MNKVRDNMKTKFFCKFLLLVLPFILLSLHARAEFDVAGLRIGMTESEAKAALKSYDPNLKISPVYGYFPYFDGVNHGVRSPEFLDRIETFDKANRKEFVLQFSGPSEAPRVIGIMRDGLNVENPPAPQQFTSALITKYGKPTLTTNGALLWDQPGKPQCNRRSPQSIGNQMFNLGNTEQSLTVGKPKHLPANLEECGVFMVYQFPNYQAVKGFIVYVTDVGAYVKSERKTNNWVDALEKNAQSKTQNNGKVPRL